MAHMGNITFVPYQNRYFRIEGKYLYFDQIMAVAAICKLFQYVLIEKRSFYVVEK